MKLFLRTFILLLAPLLATAQAHDVTLNWGSPATGGTPQGYNVYRTAVSGGCATVAVVGCLKVGGTNGALLLTFIDATPAVQVEGSTFFYVITAFNTKGESGPSVQSNAATIPFSLPGVPQTPSAVPK